MDTNPAESPAGRPRGSGGIHPSLVPNFSWVVGRKLAASGAPGYGRWPLNAFRALREEGLRVVLSLQDRPPCIEALEAAGLHPLWFPIVDHSVPDDLETFATLVDLVHGLANGGQPVLVHCSSGLGLCALFLRAYLGRHLGLPADRCSTELRRLRPPSLETEDQRQALRTLARMA